MTHDKSLQKTLMNINDYLLDNDRLLVTAESCTGGWIAEVLTSVAGCSKWFERGFVCYSNLSKQQMLSVEADILQQYGAVSQQCALAMAEGAVANSMAHYSIITTGIAGPGGGTKDKPVGTVWFAFAGHDLPTEGICQHFTGARDEVRVAAVRFALESFVKFISYTKNVGF